MSYEPEMFVSPPVGVTVRKGCEFVASFDGEIDELKVRNGRLTAKVGGVWHIVPPGATAAWVPKKGDGG